MFKILPRIYRASQLGLLQAGVSESYGVRLYGPRLDATFHMIARENYGNFVMESLRGADPSLTFLDIGANIGLFSCALYDHFEGKVHSFEPNPKTFGYLQQNLLANNAENARAWCAGIFDANRFSAALNHSANRSGASERTDRIVIEMSENTSDAATLDEIRKLITTAGLTLADRKGSPNHADELFVRK